MSLAARSHVMRCLRSQVTLSAEVRSTRPGGEFSRLLNLSGSGCLIDSQAPHRAGEVVFLCFSLPGQKDVSARGRVARVAAQEGLPLGAGLGSLINRVAPHPSEESGEATERYLLGVAFEHLPEQDAERIVHHLSARR